MENIPYACLHAAVAEHIRHHRLRPAIDVRSALECQLDCEAIRALEIEAVALCRAIARGMDMGIWRESTSNLQCFHVTVLKNGMHAAPLPNDVFFAAGSILIELDACSRGKEWYLTGVHVVPWEEWRAPVEAFRRKQTAKLALQARILARGAKKARHLYIPENISQTM